MSVNSVVSASKPPVPQIQKIPIPPLLGASLSELTDWVQQQEQPAYRGKQLHQWIYQRAARSLTDITVFSKQWRESVAEIPVGRSTLHHRSTAPDGTVKYLLQLIDGEIVETVGIPTFKKWGKNNRQAGNSEDLERLTVCVSTQVGCPMACDFCATGKGVYKRNLARHEIVDQVLTVQEDFGHRVTHIVFMGMGEPLLNVDNTLSSIQCLNKDVGIGQRNLTLSTVGIPGRIRHLAKHRLQITLAVSLHAPNQELREEIIPSAHKYQIEELLAECRDYVEMTGRRVSFEYILLAGVNDLPEHAHQLSRQLRGFQSHVNLIPYNPIQEADYKRPNYERIQAFVQALEKHHIAHSVRYSRGLEADAACGQLRASNK
ncbi:23S rRNA (adenine(2503)-C(2))-methyltransferase RlmN [Plectonema cf. radiosum LEGE 06105]|uniref:Probable dual-specificity RNA methyltransferase RlmN n=1 Tax=Plectonema cf. radiosum LEGE 06105 TaxID=945769 RepID=A0A8J7F3Z6_9CYAN|nr:23S rRNA (adenine(2503)-C(2))-methyltransferase RlmN [Plectonema radiosum]MBE9214667.1 23S rRNA (adenine(2503)-C(2))-methyltransferase RlmN [Plectonema cf. radiosum LEGE 06105]